MFIRNETNMAASFQCLTPEEAQTTCASLARTFNTTTTIDLGNIQRFHVGIIATVYAVIAALFVYRFIANMWIVPWRQSAVYYSAFLSCIMSVVWMARNPLEIQDLGTGVAWQNLGQLALSITVCALFGYIMKLDNELRQYKVHWRVIVQWIFLVSACIANLASIQVAKLGLSTHMFLAQFLGYLFLAIATADRALLLMNLTKANQRSSVAWFRKVNFVAFFIAICKLVSAIVSLVSYVKELEIASSVEGDDVDPKRYAGCMHIEMLELQIFFLDVSPLIIVLTALWDDPRTVLAVKRLESRKTSTLKSKFDAFISRNWRTLTFLILVSLLTFAMASLGGRLTCTTPHGTALGSSVFLARTGATPFYILLPAVFLLILNGFNTSLESTMLGSFLPRANGSMELYHKYVGWLCLISTFIHVGGHFGTLKAYSLVPDEIIEVLTQAAENEEPGSISLRALTYFAQMFGGQAGRWLLPWVTGFIMTFLMIAVVASYYAWHKMKFKRFKKVHVWCAYGVLVVGIFHGLGKILGLPWIWLITVIVVTVSALDWYWCKRGSEEVRCSMKEYTTKGARGRMEVILILKFKTKRIKFNPGEYLLLHIPQISVSDQHPFTLVTNVPEDEYELHIKVSDIKVNAWTRNLTRMLDFKYGRMIASHTAQRRTLSESGDLEEQLLDGDNGLGGALDDMEAAVNARVIGGFKSSLADSDYLNGDFVFMIGFSVGATPFCAYLNRIPEDRMEALRDNIWFFHRSEFFTPPDGGKTRLGAYGAYVSSVCEDAEKRLGRDPEGPAGPIYQATAGESRGAFWNKLRARVAESIRSLPPSGSITIGYCGSLRGLDSLYDALDEEGLAAHPCVKFYIESFG
eukprot:m.353016 g.353016  ORF g.353016 m.353016 type:complete len:861 (-) comp16666_c0_seq1:341-2923(-)